MAILLQIDFPYEGPFGEAMSQAMADLAKSISQEPGFIWKIWTENEATREAGGIYLFEDTQSAEKYLKMHTERLASFGIKPIRAKFFSINKPLSMIDQANWL